MHRKMNLSQISSLLGSPLLQGPDEITGVLTPLICGMSSGHLIFSPGFPTRSDIYFLLGIPVPPPPADQG